ncbi:PREDICTED: toll-like receptor 7 [Branchiostoma belcheri]|uniref:Toll-like receptor 7 n=1 Tax=Branchiostoma belcheri TaxID=7741 RepID=A0A6P4ZCC4_BRABE|nr:PREDICTED: toll-like receptor 7 [Branchiostoma belcheri]
MGSLTLFFLFTLLTITTGKTVDYTGRNLLCVPMDKIRDAYVVKLSDNKITDLGSFNSSPKIRYLYIDNNEVNNISKQTFQGLDELVHLNLNKNYISALRQFTFSALSALLDLYLNNNFISVISDRAFYGLTNLEYLDLSGNRLSVFPTQAIKLIPSKQLLWVMIRVNNISQIPTDIKTIHPSTSYDLQGNPLRCSDELATRKNTSYPGYNLEVSFYTINTIHNRSFVEKTTFLKKFHSYFGRVSQPQELYTFLQCTLHKCRFIVKWTTMLQRTIIYMRMSMANFALLQRPLHYQYTAMTTTRLRTMLCTRMITPTLLQRLLLSPMPTMVQSILKMSRGSMRTKTPLHDRFRHLYSTHGNRLQVLQ